jgi:hypothetical protein
MKHLTGIRTIMMTALTAFIMLVCTQGNAATRTWTGAANLDFNNGSNYTPTGPILAGDDIVISLSSSVTVTVSANITVNSLTFSVSGSNTGTLSVGTSVLTVTGNASFNGVTYSNPGNYSICQLNVGTAPAGIVVNGNLTMHTTGSGNTYFYAATANPGSITCRGDLTLGQYAQTSPGVEPDWIFDAPVSQTITCNNTSYHVKGEDIIFGLTNAPVVTMAGNATAQNRFQPYDGDLTINANTTVQANRAIFDTFVTGGIMTMQAGSKLEINFTHTFPGYNGGVAYSTINLNATSTVEYLGAASAQSVRGGLTYGHLIIGGSGNKTASANMTIQGDFLVRSGATYLGSTAIHNLRGNFTNNGTFTANTSTFILDGTGTQTIGGTVSSTFYNLTVDKSSGTAFLGINTSVGTATAGVMAFTDGPLNLNAFTLIINNANTTAVTRTAGYAISENTSNSSKMQWNMGSTTGSHVFPFGTAAGVYIPFTLNLTAGTIGNVTVSTYPTAATNLPLPTSPTTVTHVNDVNGVDNSANTVDRFWQVDKTGASGTATMTFIAAPAEIGTITTLRAQRWNSGGWEVPIAGQTNPANGATVSGVTSFSPWTLSGNNSPLPIELLFFSASERDVYVDLQWATATETNNDQFIVEKTRDGSTYELVTIVDSKADNGNSKAMLEYSAIDEHPYEGVSYYRLTQTDFNGKQSSSDLVAVSFEPEPTLSVYPNPISNSITLMFTDNGRNDNSTYYIYDAIGKLIRSEVLPVNKGVNSVSLDLSSLESGVYFISVRSETQVMQQKFIKE